jgi:hypothetical protein
VPRPFLEPLSLSRVTLSSCLSVSYSLSLSLYLIYLCVCDVSVDLPYPVYDTLSLSRSFGQLVNAQG